MRSITQLIEVPETYPQVVAVHPTMGCWPTNILRAHIVFDRPIQTTDVIRHIKLIDGDGADISDALLDLSDGLWTTDQQTLTILFHPGRVKTGLAAGDLYGPTFAIGYTYRLIVSEGILSADGQPLKCSYCHRFRVGPPINQQLPSIADKRVLTERTSYIETAQPLDFLSTQAYIAVTDRRGNRVPSQVTIAANGQSISVHLSDAHKGDCILRVHPSLEDVAGNRVNNPFETLHEVELCLE